MLDGLIAFFVGLWNGVKLLFNTVWTWTHNVWAWLLLITVGTWNILNKIGDGIVWLFGQIPTLGDFLSGHGALSGYSLSALGYANYVFPLDSLLGAVAVYASAWIVALVYRVIKSWIPTLA